MEGQGFEPIVRNGVELQVQQIAKINFQLKVQAVANTVEVAAGAPLVDTESATVGMVINNKSITDLPLNGRSFIDLIALDSNVESGQTANSGWSTIRGNADRGSVSISVAGMRREFTQYSLDGVPNSEVDFNTYSGNGWAIPADIGSTTRWWRIPRSSRASIPFADRTGRKACFRVRLS